MKKYVSFLCSVFVLAAASSSFALDPLLIGNFEDGQSSTDRYDLWYGDDFTIDDVTLPAVTVTRGTHSLKCTSDLDGWRALAYPLNERADKADVYALCANEGAVLAFDITFETVPGGAVQIGYYTNNGAGVEPGWNMAEWVPVPAEYLDGLPHRWSIPLAPLQASLLAAIDDDGGYYNIGPAFDTGTGPFTFYIDNVWIYPEGLIDEYGPYDPSVEQEFNVNPLYVDLSLHWKAGADPNDEYAVNPLIVDQYVFMTNGSDTDPNLYYLGSTGEDPGLVDPNSQYPQTGTLLLPINSTFQWAVVEALEDHEQTFTMDNTINEADPNNIIGPVWSFNTLSTRPSISTQPTSIRIPLGQTADPAFSVVVQSVTPPSYQWYSSSDGVISPDTDVVIGPTLGGDTDSLTITATSASFQRYVYCRVWNAATESGGGAFPDIYSNVVTLIVERKVAEYKFENNLTDTGSNIATDLHDGTAVNGAGFSTDSIEGSYSLSLNGTDQYVDLGVAAYPKAALTDAGGIGGGLDVGSVMCWIKLDTAPSATAAILSNQNPGWPVTWSQLAIEADGANTNVQSFIWGDADNGAVFWQSWRPTWVDPFSMAGDGQWHMIAVTWDMNGIMQTYVDGSLIATTGTGIANTFSAWVNSTLIGAAYSDADIGTTGSYFDGLIDNLRVYNYEVAPEVIAQEYSDVTGNPGCIYLDFVGSAMNADNTGTSYCRIDIADLAAFAGNWLNDGFYPIP